MTMASNATRHLKIELHYITPRPYMQCTLKLTKRRPYQESYAAHCRIFGLENFAFCLL